jgi:glycine cleavage system H protein
MQIPNELRYTKEHEWVRVDGDEVTVGITDYAQNELGEIVFIELPEVGETCEQGGSFGVIEAVKTVADMYAPAGGEITAVNGKLNDSPETVNKDPYGEGWMIKIKASDLSELDSLMDAVAYKKMLES